MTKRMKNIRQKSINQIYAGEIKKDPPIRKHSSKNAFFDGLLKYKEFFSYGAVVITVLMNVMIAYAKNGFKDYFGIPSIIDISFSSFSQYITQLFSVYVLAIICFIIAKEIMNITKINLKKNTKYRFVKLMSVYWLLLFFGIPLFLIMVSTVSSFFDNYHTAGQVHSVSFHDSKAIILAMAALTLIAAILLALYTKPNEKESIHEKKEKSVVYVSQDDIKKNNSLYHIGLGLLIVVFMLIAGLCTNVAYMFGQSLAESVKRFASVSIEGEKYAILANSNNGYVCVRYQDKDGNVDSFEDTIYKVIDIKNMKIESLNCKYKSLFLDSNNE